MSLLPPEVSSWLAVTLAMVSFLASFVTASAGLGGGVIMLAALASALPAVAVIPVHGVVQLGSNGGRAWLLRPRVVRGVLAWFAAGAVIGALAGGKLYVSLPGAYIKLVLGVFILYTVWGPKIRRATIGHRAFLGVGAVTSFLTMFVGGTGPFVALFVSPDRFGKERTVATHAACMSVQHGLKVLVFGGLGFAFAPWLVLIAVLVAAGFLGTVVGRAVLLRLPERAFLLVFRTALTALALRLLWAGGTGL